MSQIWNDAHKAWEREKCACHSFDPERCVELRYGQHVDPFECGSEEPCECTCHDHFYDAQDQEDEGW